MIRKRARDFKLAQLVIVLALVFLTLNFPRLAIGIYEVKRFLFEKCKFFRNRDGYITKNEMLATIKKLTTHQVIIT